MVSFYTYFCAQMKRMRKLLPAVLLATFVSCVCLGLCLGLYMKNSGFAEKQQKFRIGLVGDISGSYLGMGIYALQSVDDSRFLVDFCPMTEEEARRQYLAGSLSGYVRVPEGLVDSLVWGRNDRPITYVCAEGQRGITGILMGEIADVVSVLVTRSQSAVYGMQEILLNRGKRGSMGKATDQMELRLANIVLNRTGLCRLELLGISDGLSVEGYYLCAFSVFFFMLFGIYGSPLFTDRSRTLTRLVKAGGMGAFRQVAGEYLAFAGMNALCCAEVSLLLGIVLGRDIVQVAEWEERGAGAVLGFFAALLPVTAMLSALQFLLYELTTGVVSSVLLQFVCSIAMCYLAGCFYPAGFFPETLQKIGGVLPAGVAVSYAQSCLKGCLSPAEALAVFLYLLLFLGLAVAVRKYRLGE